MGLLDTSRLMMSMCFSMKIDFFIPTLILRAIVKLIIANAFFDQGPHVCGL